MYVEIMDTTLRDGEQTSGVSFSTSEKLAITRLLLQELHVPRIEIASARVSEGEREAVGKVCAWAASTGYIGRIEVLRHGQVRRAKLFYLRNRVGKAAKVVERIDEK